MRKKLLVLTMACCMAFSAFGCSMDKEAGKEPAVESESREEDGKKSGAVFGGDNTDYSEYEHLQKEALVTEAEKNEETGEMESQSVDVLVPSSDYVYVGNGNASSDKMGVNFDISLNPYIQYKQEDYLLSENMEVFLKEEFDPFYNRDYYEVVIGEVEEHGKDCVSANVSYLEYDEWNKTYVAYDCSYMLMELSDELIVLVEVEIVYEETTGKTVELVEELEAFYGFDIVYDKDAAAKKEEDYLKSADSGKRRFTTGYFLFELPSNWDSDWDFPNEGGIFAYAPDGDASDAGCVISISREYYGQIAEFNSIFENEDTYKQILEDSSGYSINNFTKSEVDTVLGEGIKFTFDTSENGETYVYAMYFIYNEGYVYSVQTTNSDGSEDAIALAEEILKNGQIKVY